MDTGMDMQMQAPVETPVSLEKKKGGKGWMICSIITILLLIGVSVFAVILFVNKDNTNTADLKKQIEEKDAKIATLEENASEEKDCDTEETEKKEETTPAETKPTATTSGTIDIDFNDIKSAAKSADGLKDFTNIVIKKAEGSNYIVAGGRAVEDAEAGGYYLFMYKENKAGASWKKLTGTQAGLSCSYLSQTERDVLRGVETCYDDSGNMSDIQ